jgi:hypothetical protein
MNPPISKQLAFVLMSVQFSPSKTLEEFEQQAERYIAFYEKEYEPLRNLNDLLQEVEYIQAKVDNVLTTYSTDLGYRDIDFS